MEEEIRKFILARVSTIFYQQHKDRLNQFARACAMQIEKRLGRKAENASMVFRDLTDDERLQLGAIVNEVVEQIEKEESGVKA